METLVSFEVNLISSPFILNPGSGKAHNLTLVILFPQERLQEALKKLSQEQQEAEQLEADINEERATWKVGRHYS